VRNLTGAIALCLLSIPGHELLVRVEKDAITYNDMLGRSIQVPIQSRRPLQKQNMRNSAEKS
jgi:hypothetical protein